MYLSNPLWTVEHDAARGRQRRTQALPAGGSKADEPLAGLEIHQTRVDYEWAYAGFLNGARCLK